MDQWTVQNTEGCHEVPEEWINGLYRTQKDVMRFHHTVAAPEISFCRCYGGARRFTEGDSICVTWFSTTTPPHISSYRFTCLLSEASLWSMKSAIQIDCIIIIIRLLPTDAHIAVFPLRRSLTKCMQHVIDSAIPNTSLTSVGVKVGAR